MNQNFFTKQMLEEQYSYVLSRLIDCGNDNLLLSQVCYSAYLDLQFANELYTKEELVAMDITYIAVYYDLHQYYAGTTYGKSKEVYSNVKQYSKDRKFIEQMLRRAEHYLGQIGIAA